MSPDIVCGPLLRYTYIDYETEVWNGSLLLVLKDGFSPAPLRLTFKAEKSHDTKPHNIFTEGGHSFWRYPITVKLSSEEQKVEYDIEGPHVNGFFSVPGINQSMRVMFHSCNGFSVNVPEDAFAGPALWNDVLRTHADHPFHVMIGGGDQIYSDRVCVNGPLKSWAKMTSPRLRAKTLFTEELSRELDEWYFNNYVTWYNTDPFRKASSTIPSIQIWDDHDIIDGFGSYQDRFMRSPVFLGIGKAAHKYYFLFQQHTAPYEIEKSPDPSFVLSAQPGPYIPYRSVSLSSNLGPRTVFFGLECRVERTRTRVCYESTYDAMFSRLNDVIVKGRTKHLILLLGVPIAYPRLVWLEGILNSSVITAPIKWGHKLFGVGGSMFNNFDGSSELLDDLNDHWCAVTHKYERNVLVERLHDIAEAKQVRVTILSGDVHLAAVGRFYSAPRYNIPQNKDSRYMINIISSAITNTPPPNAVADLLHRRNRIHRLSPKIHENLMPLFREDPRGKPRKSCSTMPARNYAIITEHAGILANQSSNGTRDQNGNANDHNGTQETDVDGSVEVQEHPDLHIAKDERGGTAEENVSASAPVDGTSRPYALDIAFRVEIDPKDYEGRTKGYGFSIPSLEV